MTPIHCKPKTKGTMMGATSKSKRDRWGEVVAKTGKCPFCPPHNGENAKKRARTDKYKSKRKGR